MTNLHFQERQMSLRIYYVGFAILSQLQCHPIYEPQRQTTYLRTCAPSENSDQSGHSRCLIGIFTRRISDSQVWTAFSMRTTKTLIRLRGCAVWFEASLGSYRRWVSPRWCSYICSYYREILRRHNAIDYPAIRESEYISCRTLAKSTLEHTDSVIQDRLCLLASSDLYFSCSVIT